MSDQSSNDRSEPAGPPAPRAGVEEFRALVARARKGDHSAVPRLSQFVSVNPQLWQHYGNLGRQVRMAWIRLAAGNDLFHQQCLRWRAADMHRELVGGSTSRVVRLMAERVVLAWLQACYFDGIEVAALSKPEPLPLLNYRAKRGTQASRQYLLALAAFATLRKLLPNESDDKPALPNACSSNPLLVPVPRAATASQPAAEPTAGPAVEAPAPAPKPEVRGGASRRRMKRVVTGVDEPITPAVQPSSAGGRRVRPRARPAGSPPACQTVASPPKSGRGSQRKRSRRRRAPQRQPEPCPT